jgi:hypothetical protein
VGGGWARQSHGCHCGWAGGTVGRGRGAAGAGGGVGGGNTEAQRTVDVVKRCTELAGGPCWHTEGRVQLRVPSSSSEFHAPTGV